MARNWIDGIVGIWILLSPWLLGFSGMSLAKWSSVLCGIILILLSVWTLFGERTMPAETAVGATGAPPGEIRKSNSK